MVAAAIGRDLPQVTEGCGETTSNHAYVGDDAVIANETRQLLIALGGTPSNSLTIDDIAARGESQKDRLLACAAQ